MTLGVDWSAEMAAEFSSDFGAASFTRITGTTPNPALVSGPPIVTSTEHTCRALALRQRRGLVALPAASGGGMADVRAGELAVIILRGTIEPAAVPASDDPITFLPPGASSTVTATITRVLAVTEAFITVAVAGAGV